jgi:citrate synthase
MAQPRTARTELCGVTAERIEVRGHDLASELMGKLTFTEMFLLHLLGSRPTALQLTVTDAVMVAIMEHGLVPSAVAARLTLLGAPESYQGAVAAGLLGVGDRFAGTASQCAAVLEPIALAPEGTRAQRALLTVEAYRREGKALPGFGHPIHRDGDPRVARLIAIAREAGAPGRYILALEALERAVTQVLGRKLPTNVSAAIAVVLGEAGLPAEVVRGVVLTARCAGLVGHLHEEAHTPAADEIWQAAERAVPYRPPG